MRHQLTAHPQIQPDGPSFDSSLTSFAQHAVSVASMQRIDTEAIETLGIPRLLLMEHAGLAVARCAHTLLPTTMRPIVICCGRGYNGGDGLAAARHLHASGYQLHLVLAARRDQLRDEPAMYANIMEQLGVSLLELGPPIADSVESWQAVEHHLAECGLIIDALLGIGMRGPVREPLPSLITRINAAGTPILAVDVPSGLDADSGAVRGVAVKATCTVTLGLPKHGCFIGQGPAHTGSLFVDSISLPRHLLDLQRS